MSVAQLFGGTRSASGWFIVVLTPLAERVVSTSPIGDPCSSLDEGGDEGVRRPGRDVGRTAVRWHENRFEAVHRRAASPCSTRPSDRQLLSPLADPDPRILSTSCTTRISIVPPCSCSAQCRKCDEMGVMPGVIDATSIETPNIKLRRAHPSCPTTNRITARTSPPPPQRDKPSHEVPPPRPRDRGARRRRDPQPHERRARRRRVLAPAFARLRRAGRAARRGAARLDANMQRRYAIPRVMTAVGHPGCRADHVAGATRNAVRHAAAARRAHGRRRRAVPDGHIRAGNSQ